MRLTSKLSTTAEIRMPIHPGEILQEEMLAPLGMSIHFGNRGTKIQLLTCELFVRIERGRG